MSNGLDSVIQSVNETIKDVVGPSPVPAGQRGTAGAVGAGTAYQMVAQATAFSIQDSVDYLQSTLLVNQATVAVVVAQLLAGTIQPTSVAALAIAQQALATAQENLAVVGTTATTIATTYPSE